MKDHWVKINHKWRDILVQMSHEEYVAFLDHNVVNKRLVFLKLKGRLRPFSTEIGIWMTLTLPAYHNNLCPELEFSTIIRAHGSSQLQFLNGMFHATSKIIMQEGNV